MLHLGSVVMREMITVTSPLSTEQQSGATIRKEKLWSQPALEESEQKQPQMYECDVF